MLKKLFKYDWKSFWKVPAAINLFLIIITILGIISFIFPIWELGYNIIDALMIVALMLYYIAIIAASLSVTIYIAIRYYKNIYTDEGYLTNTLPVTARQIILSKLFNAIIWSFITSFVVIISVFSLIIVGMFCYGGAAEIQDFMNVWPELIREIEIALGINFPLICLFTAVLSIVSTFFSILMMYSAISLGQLFTRHKIAGAVIWYIAEYVIVQIGSSIALNLPLLFGLSDLNYYNSDNIGNKIIMPILILYTVVLLVLSVGLYFITEYMLKKKLNLD